MASEAQIAANRANAAKSTGPRTAEGKARVAQNGLKHGFCARNALLPGEDPAEFQALVDDLRARWRPADDVEMGLLLQYADATWRLERAPIVETGLLLEGWPEGEEAPEGIDPGVWGIGKAFLARGKEIARLSLHESRLSRLRERARNELDALQAARRARAAELALDSQRAKSPSHAPAGEEGDPARSNGKGEGQGAAPSLAPSPARRLDVRSSALPQNQERELHQGLSQESALDSRKAA